MSKTVDPSALIKETGFLPAMTRFVNRVGVVACLNRADDKKGAFLFSQAVPEAAGAFVGAGGLTFAGFVSAVAPSICEVLTKGEGGIYYKTPQVPQAGAVESGYVLDARNPFIELGRGKTKAESLTNGAAVLSEVGKQLQSLANFQRRGNDLLDLFAATLAGLSNVEFSGAHVFSGFAYGNSLPPRFVEPFVNYLFHSDGGVAAFDDATVWAAPAKEVKEALPPADGPWKLFHDDPNRQKILTDVVVAFKACLRGKPDNAVPLVAKVAAAYKQALDPTNKKPWYGEKAAFGTVPGEYAKAFEAYHYVSQVLRSKVLLMSVAETVVQSYFGDKTPDDHLFEKVFADMRAGNGYPAPVRRLPEKHRRRLRQAMTQHLEYLLQEIRWRSEGQKPAGVPTAAELYEQIAERLKKAKKDPEGDGLRPTLDNLTDDLLGENRDLTAAEKKALGITLDKDELAKIQLLREAGMKLPEGKDGLRAFFVLRATARMAGAMTRHLATFDRMFQAGDPAYRGFLRASQNLVREVVCPIIFAAPGLSPEQLVALFKESVNATFVNAVLLDEGSLEAVFNLAEEYKDKITARMEDAKEDGQSVFRLKRGAGAKTVVEFLPALLDAVLKASGTKLTEGLETLNLLLGDFVRRVRNAAANRKAGMGTVFSIQKGVLGKAAAAKAAEKKKSSTAAATPAALEPELENVVVEVITKKEPAATAIQLRQENVAKIGTAVAKHLPKSGTPDWGKVLEAAEAADKNTDKSAAQDRVRAVKLAWYGQLAAEQYKARAAEVKDADFETAVEVVAQSLTEKLEEDLAAARDAIQAKLDAAVAEVVAESRRRKRRTRRSWTPRSPRSPLPAPSWTD